MATYNYQNLQVWQKAMDLVERRLEQSDEVIGCFCTFQYCRRPKEIETN